MVARLQDDDLHGIPMTEEAFEHLIGLESPYRYELIDGIAYDMTGSTPEHGTIAGNIFSLQDQIIRLEELNLELPLTSIYKGVL